MKGNMAKARTKGPSQVNRARLAHRRFLDFFRYPFQRDSSPDRRRPTRRPLNFLTLPKEASAKLPSRGVTLVEGTLRTAWPLSHATEPQGRPGKPLVKSGPQVARTSAARRRATSSHWKSRRRRRNPDPGVQAPICGRPWRGPAESAGGIVGTSRPSRRDWIQWIESAKREETH